MQQEGNAEEQKDMSAKWKSAQEEEEKKTSPDNTTLNIYKPFFNNEYGEPLTCAGQCV